MMTRVFVSKKDPWLVSLIWGSAILPLVAGLLIAIGNERYALPVSTVEQILEIRPEEIQRAQGQEMILDTEQKIARPRQVYTGVAIRDYEPIEKRASK